MQITMNTANEKILYILEKLKEEWDLVPKKDVVKRDAGLGRGSKIVTHYKHPREARISSQRLWPWMQECGIDYHQLEYILRTLEQEGLIIKFRTFGEYE